MPPYKKQYVGHLIGSHYNDYSTLFICVDTT